ncbi:MAG: hypothetical protein ACFCU4_01605 [Puniceicoccaceae bacterium]
MRSYRLFLAIASIGVAIYTAKLLPEIWHRVSTFGVEISSDQPALNEFANRYSQFYRTAPATEIKAFYEAPTIRAALQHLGIGDLLPLPDSLALVLYPSLPDHPVPIAFTSGLGPDGLWTNSPYGAGGGFIVLSNKVAAYRAGGRDLAYLLRDSEGQETTEIQKAIGPSGRILKPDTPHPFVADPERPAPPPPISDQSP